MTAEVCLMNRAAAVLAADSAITTSHYDPKQNKRVPRYLKGANKIFELSAYHPIGMMIYDTASLHGMPWETLVKQYRGTLSDTAYASPADYASDLFTYLQTNKGTFFPAAHLDNNFVQNAAFVAVTTAIMLSDDARVKAADLANTAAVHAAYRQALTDRTTNENALPFASHFSSADVASAIAAHRDAVAQEFLPHAQAIMATSGIDAKEVADLAILSLYKRYQDILGATGIVVAGFGKDDVFPRYNEYLCYGFMRDKLVVDDGSHAEISYSTPSEIRAFATTSMVDTFEMGFSNDVFGNVRNSTEKTLRNFGTKICSDLGVAPPRGL